MPMQLYLFEITLALCFLSSFSLKTKCIFDGTDLSTLDKYSWQVGHKSNAALLYRISLCTPFNATGCENSLACLTNGTNNVNIVPYTNISTTVSEKTSSGMFWLYLNGGPCKKDKQKRIVINFKCGPHMGLPKYLFSYGACDIHLEWRTSFACNKPKKFKKEIPCYVYDSKNKKHDLTPLIKSSGYYELSTLPQGSKFWINVCSGINIDQNKDNSSALFIIDNEMISFGKPSNPLQLINDVRLELVYESDGTKKLPSGCTAKPKTTIIFVCPTKRMTESIPIIISWDNCQYLIKWITEYACPTELIEGNTTDCSFKEIDHGFSLSLQPLIKDKAPFYKVNGKWNNTNLTFTLNVCHGFDKFKCGEKEWKSNIVCLESVNNTIVAGITQQSKLRYSDGILSLKYLSKTKCPTDENSFISTIIYFNCDKSNTGSNGPTFTNFTDCTYFFEWSTSYACVNIAPPCSVNVGNAMIDLSVLKKSNGDKPWYAIDGISSSDTTKNNKILMNICGAIPKTESNNGCKPEASVCLLEESESDNKFKAINLGYFLEDISYKNSTKEIVMKYNDGEICKDQIQYQSTITFICNPGQLNTAPILTDKSEDGCHYKFEWYTAAACISGNHTGVDCKVRNKDLGINYDLSKLSSDTGYKIEHGSYSYFLNVCNKLKNSPCSSDSNAGACQMKTIDDSKTWNLGQVNSNVIYQNGFLYLDYNNGDSYSSGKLRKTHIAFLCDYNAGIGKPEFVDEVDQSYVFDWFTSYACPEKAVACVAFDNSTGKRYDLSQINGVKKIEIPGKENHFMYLSACQYLPIRDVPANCNSKASACLTKKINGKEVVVDAEIGKFIEPPNFESDGRISLKYTSEKTCIDMGKKRNVTTTIQFVCTNEDMDNRPISLSNNKDCEYMVMWPTVAACPIEELEVKDSCKIKDPNSGETFDFSELKQPTFYSVDTTDTIFQINICGKVSNSFCKSTNGVSACIKKGNDDSKAIGYLSTMKLEYSTEGLIRIVYTNDPEASTDPKTKIIIILRCDMTSSNKNPSFIGKEGTTYTFELKTKLSCSHHINCLISDVHGNQYDLSKLSLKEKFNWQVFDLNSGLLKVYHINICKPLVRNKLETRACPGGFVGACETTMHQNTEIGSSLGVVASEPEVSDNGAVILRYKNGDPCDDSRFKKSTRITFICSHKYEKMVFVGITPECEYMFTWATPAGCPLQRNYGSDCAVNDPLFGSHFDLKPLHNMNKNYVADGGNHKYILNVCGPLINANGTCKDASACQLSEKLVVNAGKPSEDLIYDDGELILNYAGGKDKCHGKYERKTSIIFMCDHSMEEKGPEFFTETDDCTYVFRWKTKRACPNFFETGCAVVDSNQNAYDLSSVSLANDNYYISTPDLPSVKFVINICRSIVPRKGVHCPYSAGSCMIRLNETDPNKRFVNLGDVNFKTFPQIVDNKMTLSYLSGDICGQDEKRNNIFRKTVIKLICSRDSNLASSPEYVSQDIKTCTYYFMMRTLSACPISDQTMVSGNCSVENPKTGFMFDLNSLKRNNGYEVRNHNGHKFVFNVCDKLSDSKCSDGSGSCQEEILGTRYWNAGNANAKLVYQNGALLLNYTGGSKCHDGMFERNTVIQFVCGDTEDTTPVFISESHECTYFFMWHTRLACETEVTCETLNGPKSVDLSSLMLSSSSHGFHRAVSLVDDSAYYVNLCRPLNPIPGVQCLPGSSLCLDPMNGPPLSLGRAIIPPFYDFQQNLIAVFSNGSACPEKPSELIQSKITFKCKESAFVNNIVLVEITDCVYYFVWETNLACPKRKLIPQKVGCVYRDGLSGIKVDLNTLKKDTNYKVSSYDGDYNYEINMCSPVKEYTGDCRNSAVCFKQKDGPKESLGDYRNQEFVFSPERQYLKLKYLNGATCLRSVTGRKSAEIEFFCDVNAGLGSPVLTNRYPCLTTFEWRTNLLCGIKKQECIVSNGDNTFDFNILSSISHSWQVNSETGDQFWLNICRGINDSPNAVLCPPSASVCLKPGNRKLDGLSTIGLKELQDITILDDQSIQLSYYGGSLDSCPHKGFNNFSTTKIIFFCSNSTGLPKFISLEDNCTYVFHWFTNFACPERELLMEESNGIVTLAQLNYTMDFSEEISGAYVTHEILRDEKHTQTNYTYYISLNSTHTDVKAAQCLNAAVCQSNGNGFYRNVGSLTSKKFLIKGTEIQLVITSEESKCGKKPENNVTSRILFSCSSLHKNPEFLYESNGCDYIFLWQTPVACIDAAIVRKIINPDITYVEPPKKSDVPVVSIVISVMVLLVLVVLLIGIFHKEDRRSAFCGGIKRCFRTTGLPTFHYSKHVTGQLEEGSLLVDATLCYADSVDRNSEILV